MKIKNIIPVIFSLYLIGCASSSTATRDEIYSNKNIPPGLCRISATIIKIDSTLLGNSENDPCSKAPCTAWVKIGKIIGYGAGSAVLNSGDTIKTKFAFTLNPTTKETFPALKVNLPGLTEGSSFVADIQLIPNNPSNPKREKAYLIYGYKKIE